MSTVIRKMARRGNGLYREEGYTPHVAPRQINTGAAVLPANDASGLDPCVVDGGATQPFDNGSADYRYISYQTDGSNGLRVSYSNDLITWVNEVAVTGFAGTSNAITPILTVDLKEAKTSRKTATKTVFYVNMAGSASARLRSLTIDNDNNKTGTPDAATASTIVGASAAWNEALVGLCYARVDSNAPNLGQPVSFKYFMIGIFFDGTDVYSLGAIYGATFDTLTSKKINVVQGVAANSTKGFKRIVPLTRELGMFHSLPEFKGIPVLMVGDVSGATARISLGICQDGFNSVKELGDSFINSNASNFLTRNIVGSSFLYREGNANPFWFLRETLSGANGIQYPTTFKGFGEDAFDDGMAHEVVEGVAGAEGVITSDNGASLTPKVKSVAVTGMSGAAVTMTGFFPAGCVPIAVVGIIDTTIVGPTSVKIGDGVDDDAFAATLALTAGTTIGPLTYTAVLPSHYATATDLVITKNGSDMSAGAFTAVLFYYEVGVPTS